MLRSWTKIFTLLLLLNVLIAPVSAQNTEDAGGCWAEVGGIAAETMPLLVYALPMEDTDHYYANFPRDTHLEVVAQTHEYLNTYGLHEVRLPDGARGWVHYRLSNVFGECDAIPVIFEPPDYVCGYDQQGSAAMISGRYILGYHEISGHGMYMGMRYDDESGKGLKASPACSQVPFMPGKMKTVLSSHVYASPDDTTEPIATYDGQTVVLVLNATIPTETAPLWYQILLPDHTMGWLRATRLAELPEADKPHSSRDWIRSEGQPATLLEGTNIWTEPNVNTGLVHAHAYHDDDVLVAIGPVLGPTRRDSEEPGNWYYVDSDWLSAGWVWEGRIKWETDVAE